jgi:transcriptional regulator with XRE-family HTH domain
MARRTELALSRKLAILVEHGKAHGLSATAYAIARATGENITNIQRILNGENANPGLRTLTALAGYFGVGLGYFDCRTTRDCQAYLAQQEANEARAEVSEAELTAQIAAWARGLSPAGLQVLKSMAAYLKQLRTEGRRGKR